ncbi:hypothetical protein TCAL_14557 [Tigriopus californicus]|uniref:Uncharacterized protein n=1 Tax=Tigriopus californicus TaxID=6832 RepID=A0A553PCT1_TIGCA|nr:hypothetical protein TCAL_14557 [Tigriopus californicus]
MGHMSQDELTWEDFSLFRNNPYLNEVSRLVVCLSWSLTGVGGSISSSSSSSSTSLDRDFFDDDSNDMFDQMEKEDRFHEALDEGFDTWEERCLKVGGQAVLDDWLQAQEHLVYCVMINFDLTKIQRQIDMTDKKRNLNLDVVFKEHCGEPVTKTRPCIEDFLEASRGCVGDDEDRNSLNITMHMIDAAVEFVCYNNGGRLACELSQDDVRPSSSHP